MRQRRDTVEHPFGTIKARMGATHFLMKTLPLPQRWRYMLAYNLTRVMNIMGIRPLMAAMSPRPQTRKKAPQRHTTKTATLQHLRQSVSTQQEP